MSLVTDENLHYLLIVPSKRCWKYLTNTNNVFYNLKVSRLILSQVFDSKSDSICKKFVGNELLLKFYQKINKIYRRIFYPQGISISAAEEEGSTADIVDAGSGKKDNVPEAEEEEVEENQVKFTGYVILRTS